MRSFLDTKYQRLAQLKSDLKLLQDYAENLPGAQPGWESGVLASAGLRCYFAPSLQWITKTH